MRLHHATWTLLALTLAACATSQPDRATLPDHITVTRSDAAANLPDERVTIHAADKPAWEIALELSSILHRRVKLDADAFEGAAFDSNARYSLNLDDQSPEDAMRAFADKMSTQLVPLRVVYVGQVILITTEEESKWYQSLVQREYDARPLLRDATSAVTDTADDRLRQLKQILFEFVDVDCCFGGGPGRDRTWDYADGKLIIKMFTDEHENFENVLNAILRAKSEKSSTQIVDLGSGDLHSLGQFIIADIDSIAHRRVELKTHRVSDLDLINARRDIADELQNRVVPDRWRYHGGSDNGMHIFGSVLVIFCRDFDGPAIRETLDAMRTP
ncbi:MAG: hypothetical protein GC162_00200 [Planctomycetes bacterium]|nr:hypothetical protein [Planctomycetota bacterium]